MCQNAKKSANSVVFHTALSCFIMLDSKSIYEHNETNWM